MGCSRPGCPQLVCIGARGTCMPRESRRGRCHQRGTGVLVLVFGCKTLRLLQRTQLVLSPIVARDVEEVPLLPHEEVQGEGCG